MANVVIEMSAHFPPRCVCYTTPSPPVPHAPLDISVAVDVDQHTVIKILNAARLPNLHVAQLQHVSAECVDCHALVEPTPRLQPHLRWRERLKLLYLLRKS